MNRKIKSILVCGLMSLFLILQVTLSLAADTSKVIVETARLREEATQDSRVLELLSQGDEVEVLSQNGDWYEVRFNGITGYLRKDLIDVSQASTTSAENGESNVNNNTSSKDNTSSVENNTSTENSSNADNNSNTNTSNGENSVDTNSTSNTSSTENTNSSGESVENETTTTQNPNELTEDEKNSTYEVIYITNLKIVPLINALNTATLEAKTQVKLQEKMNGWVNISNDEYQGWVREDQIQKIGGQSETSTEQETETQEEQSEEKQSNEQEEQETQSNIMYVNAQTVNVRSKADKSSEAITQVTINTAVEVISEEGGWSHIKVNGIEGYIATNLLSSTKQSSSRSMTTSRTDNSDEVTTSESQSTGTATDNTSNSKVETTSSDTSSSATSSTNASSSKGSEIVSYAMSFIGKPYKYGGSSPSGFDCSGFTSYVYKQYGITLNRTAASQAQNGTKVSRSDLQLGDLIMFCSPINHVGIYIGGGKIVHAANPSRGVTTDTILSGYYNTNYNCARRIF